MDYNKLKNPFWKRNKETITTIIIGRLKELPIIIINELIISKILATLKLVIKTIPFTNKNNPDKRTNEESELILKTANIQNKIATIISSIPKIFIIILFLK